jgi:hypothetical protein
VRIVRRTALLVWLAAAAVARADDPPVVEHQPVACGVPGRALRLCATISDDVQVARARVFFRADEDKYWSVVDMVFGGLTYCATLPAVRAGRARAIEYYVQALDDQYQAQRTQTFRVPIKTQGRCEVSVVEADAKRPQAMRVYATHKKQGGKLDAAFDPTGVTFVPMAGK